MFHLLRRSWGYGNPTLRTMHSIYSLTVDIVDQSLCGDNLLHELGNACPLEAFACGKILDYSGIEIYLDFIAVLNLPGCLWTLNDGQSDVNGIAVEDSGEGLAMTQLTPAALMAMGACSLDEPQPKFSPLR